MKWQRSYAAVLMLAISISAGSAAEQPCFELHPNGGGPGPEGAILLNKCTGQTWLLVGVNTGGGNVIGWHPIPIDMSSDDTPEPPKSRENSKTDTDAAYAD